ncbi:MAG: HlyC/CorC family transporter [Clostridia bacterium]|nr:HlyC/CorC family transporter [Clostridia bacterium]
MDPYPKLIISIVLLLINLLLTLGNDSLKNLSKALLNRKAEEGNKTAIKIAAALEKPGYTFRAALRTGRALCKIAATALMISAYHAPLTEILTGTLPCPGFFSMAILTGGVLVVFLLLAEIFPIRVAEQKADSLAYSLWNVVRLLGFLCYPIAVPVNGIASLFLKITGFKQVAEEALSKEEIQSVVEESGDSGLLEETEQNMLKGILRFDEKTADQVMTPRTDVFLLDAEQPLKEQLETILSEKYSRIPVYEGEIDNIIGILYLKDLLCEAYRVGFENVDITLCMREVYFVPEKKKLDRLYLDLQASKNHMAVLIDEYGGFSGIVTIEDLIEEVMGKIDDEYDEEEEEVREESDGSYLAEGSATIGEINERLGTEFDEDDEDYDTVGGLIIKVLGEIPDETELPCVEYEGYTFRVESIADRRIETVRIIKNEEETEEKEEEEE